MAMKLFLTDAEKTIINEYGNKLDLSSLNEEGKKDLWHFLNGLKLELRQNINVSKATSFGGEIEFDKASLYLIRSMVICYQEKKDIYSKKPFSFWDVKEDETVTTNVNDLPIGGEVVSPIMQDKAIWWERLNEICALLKEEGASISDVCAGHIHFDKQIIPSYDSLKNLVLLIQIYEKIYLRFAAGEETALRPLFPMYAGPISPQMYDVYLKAKKQDLGFYDLLADMQDRTNRNAAISFKNLIAYTSDKETIEIRCPNGTLDPVIWQNNISFFAHFLNACNQKLDFEKLETKLKATTAQDVIKTYSVMDMGLAFELADIIFDSSIDKLYFLRQYVKGGLPFTKDVKKKSLHI